MGFVGTGERALVDGQRVLRVLPVARDATVRFRSAVPDPPVSYGFVEFEGAVLQHVAGVRRRPPFL